MPAIKAVKTRILLHSQNEDYFITSCADKNSTLMAIHCAPKTVVGLLVEEEELEIHDSF